MTNIAHTFLIFIIDIKPAVIHTQPDTTTMIVTAHLCGLNVALNSYIITKSVYQTEAIMSTQLCLNSHYQREYYDIISDFEFSHNKHQEVSYFALT